MTEQDILGFDPRQLTVFNEQDAPKYQGNSLIYRTRPEDSISDDKIYRATIRIIYNPFNLHRSILEQQSYALHDKDGWFTPVSSLTDGDTSCPIFKAWKKCHFAKDKKTGEFKSDFDKTLWLQAASKEDGGRELFAKRFARYVTVQIIDDKNQPDLVGKYMFWKLPKTVWEIIDAQMNPSEEDNRAAIPVMDFLFGYAIKLTVKPGPGAPGDIDYKRQTSYLAELSKKTVPVRTPTGEPILNDEQAAVLKNYVQAMEEIWECEDAAERNRLSAAVEADPNTAELRNIYKSVMTQIKEWCPNLIETLGYNEWSDAVKARVQNWIDIVLSGNDPAQDTPAVAETVSAAEPAETTAQTAPDTTTSNEDDDDLPF